MVGVDGAAEARAGGPHGRLLDEVGTREFVRLFAGVVAVDVLSAADDEDAVAGEGDNAGKEDAFVEGEVVFGSEGHVFEGSFFDDLAGGLAVERAVLLWIGLDGVFARV